MDDVLCQGGKARRDGPAGGRAAVPAEALLAFVRSCGALRGSDTVDRAVGVARALAALELPEDDGAWAAAVGDAPAVLEVREGAAAAAADPAAAALRCGAGGLLSRWDIAGLANALDACARVTGARPSAGARRQRGTDMFCCRKHPGASDQTRRRANRFLRSRQLSKHPLFEHVSRVPPPPSSPAGPDARAGRERGRGARARFLQGRRRPRAAPVAARPLLAAPPPRRAPALWPRLRRCDRARGHEARARHRGGQRAVAGAPRERAAGARQPGRRPHLCRLGRGGLGACQRSGAARGPLPLAAPGARRRDAPPRPWAAPPPPPSRY